MIRVQRGIRANRKPVKIINQTYITRPTQECETKHLSYSIQHTSPSYPNLFSRLRSLAPISSVPSNDIGVARSSSDQISDIYGVQLRRDLFVTEGLNKVSFGRDRRELINYNTTYAYPHPQCSEYIQYIKYINESGGESFINAPDRCVQQIGARFIQKDYYSVSIMNVNGIDDYVGTNAESIEISWECEDVHYYDINGNEVSYYENWVSYTVNTVTRTQLIGQYPLVYIDSEIPTAVRARLNRNFEVIETEV